MKPAGAMKYPPGVYGRKDTEQLWVSCWFRGKRYARSAKTTDVRKATREREKLIAEVRGHRYVGPTEDRLTVGELLDAHLTDRELATPGGAGHGVQAGIRQLKARIGGWRAVDVTKTKLQTWAKGLLDAGSAPGTVRKHLAYLHAAYKSGAEAQLLSTLPVFPTIGVRNTRTGFFHEAEFEVFVVAISREAYGEMLADVVIFGFWSGWRQQEILRLPWADVNREERFVVLPATGTHKRPEDRRLALDYRLENGAWANHVLWQVIERRWQARKVGALLCPWVFHRAGRPVRRLDGSWANACRAVGLWRVEAACRFCAKHGRPTCTGHPTKTMHDLRRSRVRILERSRIARKVGKSFTGHLTDKMFEQYDPVVLEDQREALRVLARPVPTNLLPLGLSESPRTATVTATGGQKTAEMARK
jgi:integrase